MNGLQRYRAMLRGERVDFVPRTPILMQFAAEYIGSDYARFASDHRVLVAANVRCAADFGLEQLSCISDPYRETAGFGAAIEFVADGVPRSTHPLAATKDVSVLRRPNALASPRMRDRIEAVRAYHADFGGSYSILGWIEGPASSAANLRGVQPFLKDLIKDAAFAGDLMDLCMEVAIAFGQAQVDAGADTIGVGDAIASQVSARTYERLVWPRERKVVQALQARGALVKLHICGDTTHLLPAIAELGADILDVDHMVDLAEVRARVGGGPALAGNLDPVSAIRYGEPVAIRSALQRAYDQAGDPYLVSAGCEIPAGTPPDNLRALCAPLPQRA